MINLAVHTLGLMAQTSGGGGGSPVPGACGGGLANMLPLILMFVVFYFLLIRPQQKRAREMRDMLANLRRGDDVVTAGGLLGRISGLTDKFVTLEVAEKIRVKVLRAQIIGRQDQILAETPAPKAEKSEKGDRPDDKSATKPEEKRDAVQPSGS